MQGECASENTLKIKQVILEYECVDIAVRLNFF